METRISKNFHPKLKELFPETGGYVIYQEMLMKLCVEIAGYSLSEADNMRRIVGKKKKEDMAEKISLFKAVLIRVTHKFANQLFADIEAFHSYSFNKSPLGSLCYSLVSQHT